MSKSPGKKAKAAGIARVMANVNPALERAWYITIWNLPAGWIGICETIKKMVLALGFVPHHDNVWGGLTSGAKWAGTLQDKVPLEVWSVVDEQGHARRSVVLQRTNFGQVGKRRLNVSFDLGERIRQIRAAEAKIDAEQAALDERMAGLEKWIVNARAEVLQFLNATNQKSTNTEYGGAYWKPKVTYRVEDKEAFRRHVIGAEAWELITWQAMPSNCEAFITEHKQAPPGIHRSAVNILYITPPTKPKKGKTVQDGGQAQPAEDAADQQQAAE